MSNMANILRSVINNGGMPLTQVSERIETMYVSGRINAGERNELTGLMHEKARPENEAGDYKALYQALAEKYNELEKRVKALEGGADEEEIAQWRPWDGVNDEYQPGAVVIYDGRIWQSVYDGQNVWEPGAPGVDERYWKEIAEEAEDCTAED